MGLANTRLLGTLFDGIARHTQEGLDFVGARRRGRLPRGGPRARRPVRGLRQPEAALRRAMHDLAGRCPSGPCCPSRRCCLRSRSCRSRRRTSGRATATRALVARALRAADRRSTCRPRTASAGAHELLEKAHEYVVVHRAARLALRDHAAASTCAARSPARRSSNTALLGDRRACSRASIGTTGASVLLIRPLLRANAPRVAQDAHRRVLHLRRLELRRPADAARRPAALPRLPEGRAVRAGRSRSGRSGCS